MLSVENNATVVAIQLLPDCLFRIWIKADWVCKNTTWKPGQVLRIGILDDSHKRNSLRAMTIIGVENNIFEFYMVSVTNVVTSPRLAKLKPGDRCFLNPDIG